MIIETGLLIEGVTDPSLSRKVRASLSVRYNSVSSVANAPPPRNFEIRMTVKKNINFRH